MYWERPHLINRFFFEILMKYYLLMVVGFLCVALGQPAWLLFCAPFAAFLGYALFWKGCEKIGSVKKKFWLSLFWYSAVQAVQLSWMTAVEYQGFYILFVYLSLIFLLGLQFALLSYFIFKLKYFTLFNCSVLASGWVVLEWSRLFFLCGFSWNPAGIALTYSLFSIQMASICGILGLSFWVILSNLMTLSLFRTGRGYLRVFSILLIPYIVGCLQWAYVEKKKDDSHLRVALVDTHLLPSEKIFLKEYASSYISPFEQWKSLISTLKKEIGEERVDLIVFPEAVVPCLARKKVYPIEPLKKYMQEQLGEEVLGSFPNSFSSHVSNLFLAQTVANFYQAEVVIGLDDRDEQLNENYQAAFYLFPGGSSLERYEKNILLPLAEYLPFNWLKRFTAKYGIYEFYTPGKEVKVVQGTIPSSLSICYEDTFSHFMREGRAKGAKLFINLTNDNWYPNSRLAKQHFDHARIRAVENGVPFIRACNMGCSAAIDSLGRNHFFQNKKNSIILAEVSLLHYPTLYTQWGDFPLLAVNFFLISLFWASYLLKKLARNPLNQLNS